MIDIPNASIEVFSTADAKHNYLRTRTNNFSIAHPDDSTKVIGPCMREFVKSRDAVAVLIYCPSARKLVMSRQFRMPVYDKTQSVDAAWIYEIVAGVVGNGEDSTAAALREAQEEVGIEIHPERIHKVMTFFPSPGVNSETITIYTAMLDHVVPLNRNGGLEEEQEAIVSAWIDYDTVLDELMPRQELQDAKTFIALSHVLLIG